MAIRSADTADTLRSTEGRASSHRAQLTPAKRRREAGMPACGGAKKIINHDDYAITQP
jgi:hypothetical protein